MTDQQRMEMIANALQAFVSAQTWTEKKRIVEAQSDLLLTDEAEFVWTLLLQQYAHDQNAVRLLQEHHELLQRCRAEGIEAAFTERLRPNSPSQSIPPAFAADIQRAIAASDRLDMDRSPQALNAVVQAWQIILARPDLAQYPEFAVKVRVEFAGTPAIIASLWAVNDAATRYLFERFLRAPKALPPPPPGAPPNKNSAYTDRFIPITGQPSNPSAPPSSNNPTPSLPPKPPLKKSYPATNPVRYKE